MSCLYCGGESCGSSAGGSEMCNNTGKDKEKGKKMKKYKHKQ